MITNRDNSKSPMLVGQDTSTPIDLDQCKNHRQTTILGKPDPNSKVCPCCGLKYQKQKLEISFDLNQLSYLGCGLPLYFTFSKACAFIALMTTIVYSFTTLFFNYRSNSCKQLTYLKCSDTVFLRLSVANKIGGDPVLHQIQSYMTNATIILIFILFQICRKRMRDVQIEADVKLNPNDFAVMLSTHANDFSQQDLQNCIAKWFQQEVRSGRARKSKILQKCKKEFPIQKIVFSYHLDAFNRLQSEKNDLQFDLKAKKASESPEFNREQAVSRLQQIRTLVKNKSFIKNTKCIVLFKYPQQRRFLLSRTEKTITRVIFPCFNNPLLMNGRPLTVRRAAMPSEILWQNHQVATKTKFYYRLGTKLFCLLVICAGEGIVFGLLYAWFTYVKNKSSSFQEYVSPLISLAISAVNFLIYKILTYATKYEFRPTTLEQMVSITVKITFSVFLNSGIMLMLAYFILDLGSIWVYNGFVDTISYSYLFCIFLPHIGKYVEIDLLLGWYYRRIVPRKDHVTQMQCNKAYERPQAFLYQRYAWMVNMVWWASVFAPITPISYPCIFVSLLINYWQEKLNYICFFREPKPFGNYLNIEIFGLLELAPLFLGLGNVGLDFVVAKMNNRSIEVSVILFDLIGVGVGLLIFIIPSQYLNKAIEVLLCCSKTKTCLNQEYSECCRDFITTYERQNPVYREEVIEYIKKSEEQRFLGSAEDRELTKQLYASIVRRDSGVTHPLKIKTKSDSDKSLRQGLLGNSDSQPNSAATMGSKPNQVPKAPSQKRLISPPKPPFQGAKMSGKQVLYNTLQKQINKSIPSTTSLQSKPTRKEIQLSELKNPIS